MNAIHTLSKFLALSGTSNEGFATGIAGHPPGVSRVQASLTAAEGSYADFPIQRQSASPSQSCCIASRIGTNSDCGDGVRAADDVVAVGDSEYPARLTVGFDRAKWEAFVIGIRGGEFADDGAARREVSA